MKVGLCINPVAGLGGVVGLKGTDNVAVMAISRGATPRSPQRAVFALRALTKRTRLSFLTCSGAMGEDALIAAGILDFRVVYRCTGLPVQPSVLQQIL